MATDTKRKSKYAPVAAGSGAALGYLLSPFGDPTHMAALGASLGSAATDATAAEQRRAMFGADEWGTYGGAAGGLLGAAGGYLGSKHVGPPALEFLSKYAPELKRLSPRTKKLMLPAIAASLGLMAGAQVGGAAGSAYGAASGVKNKRRESKLQKQIGTERLPTMMDAAGGYGGYQLGRLAGVLSSPYVTPGVSRYLMPAAGAALGVAGANATLHPDLLGAERGDVLRNALIGGGLGGLTGLTAAAPVAYLLNKYKISPAVGRNVASVLAPVGATLGAGMGAATAIDSEKALDAVKKEASVQALLANPSVRAALAGGTVGGLGGAAAHALSDDPESSLLQKTLAGAAGGAALGAGGRALYNRLSKTPAPVNRQLPAIYDVVNGKAKVAGAVEQLQKTAFAAGLARAALRGALPGAAVGAAGGALAHATSDSPTSSLAGKMLGGALMGGAVGGLGGAALSRFIPRARAAAQAGSSAPAAQKLLPATTQAPRTINLGPGEYKFSAYLAKTAASLVNMPKPPPMPAAPAPTASPVPSSIGASPANALSKTSPAIGMTPRR